MNDLHTLLDAFEAGELSEDQIAELRDRLARDPEARALYIRITSTRAMIHYLAEAGSDQTRKTVMSRIQNTTTVRSVTAARPASPRQANPLRISPATWALASIAAVIALAAVVVIYIFAVAPQLDPSTPHPHHPVDAPRVATLIESTGRLSTPGGQGYEGGYTTAGEYTLDSGVAEFMLTNAVNVKLRGETRMSMHNDMHVSLARGSAEFVVPAGAKGFTVHLPGGAKVVDLGTAFVVDADPDRPTKVRVSEGAVHMSLGDQQIVLTAHQVAEIVDGRLVVHNTLPIVNASFEQPVTPSGYTLMDDVEGWSAEGHAGVHQIEGMMSEPAEGRQSAFIHWDNTAAITQTLDVLVGDYPSYELNVSSAIRRDETDEPTCTVTAELRSAQSGRVLASTDVALTRKDEWTRMKLNYTPGPDDPVDEHLMIALRRSAGLVQVQFDDVRLISASPAQPGITEHSRPSTPGQ